MKFRRKYKPIVINQFSPNDGFIQKAIANVANDFTDNLKKEIRPDTKMQMKDNDPVNNPSHYTRGGIECIDAIEAALTEEEARGFRKGNAIKYLWRAGHKGNYAEDLAKAEWYLKREAASVKS